MKKILILAVLLLTMLTAGCGQQQTDDTSVFPLPTAEIYGLTGEEATLYNAVAAFLGNDREELMLPSLTVYGSYSGDNGETYYVCGLLRLHYYGLEDLENPIYSVGSAGNSARITITEDGVCTEIMETLDGDDNTERIKEICGPLTEVAEAWNSGNDAALEGKVLTPADAQELLQPYLAYCLQNG